MQCPRCGYYNPQPLAKCPYCGLKFYFSSHLVFSIISIIFCFFPTGLIALHYSSVAENAFYYKNYYLADTASRKAETFCLISAGIGVFIWLAVIFTVFLVLFIKINAL